MKKQKKKKQVNYYVADFETTTINHLIENGGSDNNLRVWASAVATVEETPKIELITNNIEDFIKWCFTKGDKIIYFHNLNFDAQFLFYYLLKNGYTQVDIENDNKSYYLKNKQFKAMIDNQKNIYNITIKNKGVTIKINDSYKLIPSSVERIAKDFNTRVIKGSIDYEKIRPIGYELTEEEREYIKNDVLVVAEALSTLKNNNMLGLTIGAVALKKLKETIPDWKEYYPILDGAEDNYIRKSYRGGYCFAHPEKINIELGNNTSFDRISAYPAEMVDKLLPYGKGIYGRGKYVLDTEYPLYVQTILVTYKLKENMPPCIMLKSYKFSQISYSEEGENEFITLTNIDLELFLKHYYIYDIEYIDYYKYQAIKGNFDKYIYYYYDIKNNEKGSKRAIAKLMLNSVYGKFATRPLRENYEVYLDNDIVNYRASITTEIDTVYIPVATFLTSYARRELIKYIVMYYDKFIYCDTDSIKLLGHYNKNEIDIPLDDKKLGYFKNETPIIDGKVNPAIKIKVLRQKRYLVEYENGDRDIRCCGLPQAVAKNLTMKDFYIGNVIKGKKRSKRVKGGTAIIETEFTIT